MEDQIYNHITFTSIASRTVWGVARACWPTASLFLLIRADLQRWGAAFEATSICMSLPTGGAAAWLAGSLFTAAVRFRRRPAYAQRAESCAAGCDSWPSQVQGFARRINCIAHKGADLCFQCQHPV